jgi:DNA-binding SARP family transcriptional activator/predicted ATPase
MGLKIYLLGQFKLLANDRPIELPSRPAQSLLAYLALNAGVTHRREKLAGLLWPESTETNARGYLRQALWRIRKTLEDASLPSDEYLQISDISVTFDKQSDYRLDADVFLESMEEKPVEQIIDALHLYRGELLPGFYDEWVLYERDRFQATFHQKLNHLIECLLRAERWHEVMNWSEQWIRLGNSPEPAFRALMRAYAGLGDQVMISASYNRCVEAMQRELGLEPSPETKRLYEMLRCGQTDRVDTTPVAQVLEPTSQVPAFLDEPERSDSEKSVFVARETELARLDRILNLALTCQGSVVFISGEAGSGKTALINEFTRRAQNAHAKLVVASGNCNAHTGIGDPYLPFREILELLTGDVEARWAAGAITKAHARLLWNMLPVAAQAIMENGPDLINTFVPGTALINRAHAYAPNQQDWLVRLENLVNRKLSAPAVPSPPQRDLFEQYTRVLQTLARHAPQILVLDDLQWSDIGSISLLFHLGRHLAGNRILVIGAYRPEEVALGRDEARDPLEPVINELKREFGDIMISLDQAASRQFVEALLDSEPNQLGEPFREMLFRQTRGQPLFTIELLRGMQERGDLLQNQESLWIEGPQLNWERLPARVEAVIAERIGRLPQQQRAVLRVACVEGETFTAEVVAQVRSTDEREMLRLLSGELDRKHRLIHAHSILRAGNQLLSCYRFRHTLYRKYLYSNLDDVERVHLHEQVGSALEALYGNQGKSATFADIAPQLAWHFHEAQIADKAIHYLRQAGEKAILLSAYQEAIDHLTKALAILNNLPDSTARAQQELELQLALCTAWIGPKPYGTEVIDALTRALHLCHQLGETSQLSLVLGEFSVYHYVRADHRRALEFGQQAYDLAQPAKDPMLLAILHWYLGFIWFALGEYETSHKHLKYVIDFYNPQQHHRPIVFLRGSDAGIGSLAYDACCLWSLGYPDQALKRSQEALTVAGQLDHPFSLADALCFAGCMFNAMRGDALALMDNAEQLIQLANEKGFAGWVETANCFHGEVIAMLGQASEGIAQIRQGMAASELTGVSCYSSGNLRALAKAQAQAGLLEHALLTLNQAFDLVERTDERHWEAELYRLRAELMLAQGNDSEAEADLNRAIEIARRQNAKSWELRAVIDLARLWNQQGKANQAYELLEQIYGWFTEGFDTPDLIAARALLEEISKT